MDIVILVLLILLNGVFSMSEIALVTARKARLTANAALGDRGAARAIALGENPNRFLSTIQIGITSIGLLSGIFGEAALSPHLASWLQQLGLSKAWAGGLATALVVVLITYVSIVLGELLPKRIGQLKAENVARNVALPMSLLANIVKPFVSLLSASTSGLMHLLGISEQTDPVTEEEIDAILDQGSQEGAIEAEERELVRNILHLNDRRLTSFLVPRSEMVCLDLQAEPQENIDKILESKHTRFPVCNGDPDNIIGVISAKQVLATVLGKRQPDLARDMSQPLFVPETMSGLDLLLQFRAGDGQMAVVVDEYGATEGIVTVQDLLEAVTGEFIGKSEELEALQRMDGSWLLDGSLSSVALKDYLRLRSLPDEDKSSYHTLSGLIMLLLGRIPVSGEYADWGGWRFEVVDMDGKRIDRVLASPIPPLSDRITTE